MGVSYEDFTQKVSHSIYVTNFPDDIDSRGLWKECSVYGTVVDVFIPLKKSKVGKRFAFVRFIKVFNIDRLVKNLCTIWIGRHHLYANKVRFDRPQKPLAPKSNFPPFNGSGKVYGNTSSGFQHLEEEIEREALNIEDVLDSSFGRKRLCIITKSPTSILETFKIIVRGKVFLVRAKELFTWNPNFLHCKEREDVLEDASVKGDTNKGQVHVNEGEDESFNNSDVEGVAETYFDDTSMSPKECSNNRDEQILDDPFGVYDLLNKKAVAEEVQQKSPSLSHPPGFTPVGSEACKDSDHFFKE
ncbi:RNA-directed DNA polymerase, eukaryota, partial [Tanacetum coccineum]